MILLLACTGTDHAQETAIPPTLVFLAPEDSATVTSGDFSVIVENFVLESPAKHGEGEAAGYIAIDLDGAEVLTTELTQFSVDLVVGTNVVTAGLRYADGDPLEPPVEDTLTVTLE